MQLYAKIKDVEGWLNDMDADFTERLLRHLLNIGQVGAVAEFGVHKGKYLSLIHGASAEWRTSTLGVDALVDGKGNTLRDDFKQSAIDDILRSLALTSNTERVLIHQANTLTLTTQSVADLAQSPIAFISIDGGHDAETVYHDLSIAAPNLSKGGIISLDDVFNIKVPGVVEGVCRFLMKNSESYGVFAICGNKTFVTQRDHHSAWLQFCRSSLDDQTQDYLRSSKALYERQKSWNAIQTFFGYEVCSFIP